MKKKIKYSVIAFVVLSIIVIVYMYAQKYFNDSQKVDFPLSYHSDPSVIYPPDIFMNVPTFYVDGWAILDFINMKNIYSWELSDDISGELTFRFLIDFTKNMSPGMELPEFVRFELFNNRGGEKINLLDEKISPDRWELKKKSGGGNIQGTKKKIFKFRNFFKLPVNLLKDDMLVYRISFPKDYPIKNMAYGISIPQIQLNKKPEQGATNLIIISIDTLRSDYLGIYKKLSGEKVDFSFSPNLDLFAEEAVVFKNTYSPLSATWPALASMFTSLYPSEHGVTYNGMNSENNYHSIATHMVELGYNTLSILANAASLKIPGVIAKMNFFNKDFMLIEQALLELQNQGDLPFFHWYHFMGVHAEYSPDNWGIAVLGGGEKYKDYNTSKIMKEKKTVLKEDLKKIRTLYAAELYCLDFELKKIFDYLKSNKKWDSSMIIITADHGEDLYEHNDFFHHYPSLYDSSLKVPLMIKFPYQKNRIVIDEMVSLLDIFPTIADYFRLKGKSEVSTYDMSGISLLPLLQGKKKQFNSRTLFASIEKNKIIAGLKNGWKFIYNPKEIKTVTQVGTSYNYLKLELYNSKTDPVEKKNIYKKNSKLVSEFIKSIKSYLREKNAIKKGLLKNRKYKNSPETLKRLRTLGYID